MIFDNVTDITIPQGNVVKIHETNSGRVLWKKENTIETGYPRMFIEQTFYDPSENKTYYTYTQAWNCAQEALSYEGFPLRETWWRVNDLIEFGIPQLKMDKNTTFTAYYVNNFEELINYKTQAKKVNDAVWTFLPAKLIPIHANSNINISKSNITSDSTFITLSKTQGSVVKVSSIKNNFNEYVTFLENYLADNWINGVYAPVSVYPNIKGSTTLNVSSPSLGISINEIEVEFYSKRL